MYVNVYSVSKTPVVFFDLQKSFIDSSQLLWPPSLPNLLWCAETETTERADVVTEDLINATMDITNLGRTQVLELLENFQGDQALLLENFFQ
jgi:hypothetical protein